MPDQSTLLAPETAGAIALQEIAHLLRLAIDRDLLDAGRRFWEKCAAAAMTGAVAHGCCASAADAENVSEWADAMLAEWDLRWGAGAQEVAP